VKHQVPNVGLNIGALRASTMVVEGNNSGDRGNPQHDLPPSAFQGPDRAAAQRSVSRGSSIGARSTGKGLRYGLLPTERWFPSKGVRSPELGVLLRLGACLVKRC
jgi:hypothetical protein